MHKQPTSRKRLAVLITLAVLGVFGLGSLVAYAAGPAPAVGHYADGLTLVCVKDTAPYTVTGHAGARTKACPAGTTLGKWADRNATTPVAPVSAGPIAAATELRKIGGPIKEGATKLTGTRVLTAGTYRYTAYGDFSRKVGTGTAGDPDTYGSLFLWVDRDGDTDYDWADDENLSGTVQTGAIPLGLSGGSIEQSASASGYFTLPAAASVLVGGFAYNSDRSSTNTGDIVVLGATATFERIK